MNAKKFKTFFMPRIVNMNYNFDVKFQLNTAFALSSALIT